MQESAQMSFDQDFSFFNTQILSSTVSSHFDFQSLFAPTALNSFTTRSNDTALAILGDSLVALKQMKSNSVNLIFADAPYNIGKDFGNNKDKWDSISSYITWCKNWIDECMRVLSDTGTMYFMTATQHMPYLDIYASEKYHVLCRIVWSYDSSGVQSKKTLPLLITLKKFPEMYGLLIVFASR